MNTNIMKSARGFTLLEILIALLILATGLLALAKFQGTLMQDNALAKQRTEATMFAQQKIEVLRSYSQMSTYAGMRTGSDTVTGTSASFTRAWTITSYTNTSAPQYTNVVVSVTWKDNGGNNQTFRLATNIAANDPINTGQLIGTTTSLLPATTTTTSSSSSTTSSSTSSTSSSSTSSTSSTTTSSTTSSTSTTSTTQCITTVSGTTHNNNDSVSTRPSGTCTNTQTAYNCTVSASRGTDISVYETHGSNTYSGTASANCSTITINL